MAWEVAGAHKDKTKSDRSMTPWDIAEAASNGDKFMYARWKEYEDVMPGSRSCVITPSLKKKLGLQANEDKRSAEQDLEEHDNIVGKVEYTNVGPLDAARIGWYISRPSRNVWRDRFPSGGRRYGSGCGLPRSW